MKKKLLSVGLSAFLLFSVTATDYVQGQVDPAGGGAATTGAAGGEQSNIGAWLIDFNNYEANLDSAEMEKLYPKTDPLRKKKIAELTAAEKDPWTNQPKYVVTSGDMKLSNWVVKLNSSANIPANRKQSYVKPIKITKGPDNGKNVLGVRIHFPQHHHNAYAQIMPPFEVRVYDTDGKIKNNKMGVMNNVGTIKKISMESSGRNYKYGTSIRLKNQLDEVREYFMGYLYYSNWRTLMWDNPDYISSVDGRTLFRVPLYPQEVPYVKLDSIIVYSPGQEKAARVRSKGDFVAYFKGIQMWFDYAVAPDTLADIDIDDEANWAILQFRAREQRRREMKRFREAVELKRAEERKMGITRNDDGTIDEANSGNYEPKDLVKRLEKLNKIEKGETKP